MLKNSHRYQASTNIPNPPPSYFLLYIILQILKRCVGKLYHFKSIDIKDIAVRVDTFLKVIENSLNFCGDYWGLSLVLYSPHPLGVTQQTLVLYSKPLVIQFM